MVVMTVSVVMVVFVIPVLISIGDGGRNFGCNDESGTNDGGDTG